MSYIVTVMHNGTEWPLRGTVIAYSMDRAQRFETRPVKPRKPRL